MREKGDDAIVAAGEQHNEGGKAQGQRICKHGQAGMLDRSFAMIFHLFLDLPVLRKTDDRFFAG